MECYRLNGGTLDLNGTSQSIGNLSGTFMSSGFGNTTRGRAHEGNRSVGNFTVAFYGARLFDCKRVQFSATPRQPSLVYDHL